MASGTWRGVVGVIKPTYGSGSLVEFIRLLPEGVGCIPMYAGIKEHSERGYLAAMETYHEKVAELAKIGKRIARERGEELFVGRGPRNLLHANVNVRIRPLELGDQLRDDLPFPSHDPEAEGLPVRGGWRA